MVKMNKIQKTCGWERIYYNLLKIYSQNEVDNIYSTALKYYEEFSNKHNDCKGMNKVHILSAIAEGSLYLPLKDVIGSEKAIQMLTDGSKPVAIKKHDKIECLPAPLFMKVANIVTNKMFSEQAGFKRTWICNTSKEKRYNLWTCPYVDILKEMNCIEVCKAICIQDVYSFSHLKNGVIFERTKTLGNGDECCDFGFISKEK